MQEVLHIVRCVWRETFTDRTMLVAAGLAFFGLFGLLPSIAVVAGIYGLIVDQQAMQQQLHTLDGILPAGTPELVGEFLTSVSGSLWAGLGLSFNLLIVLWTVQRASSGLITALNVVYDEEERRSRLRREVVALIMAFGALAFLSISLFMIAILPLMAGGEGRFGSVLLLVRWPVLAIIFMASLALMYNFAPCRERADWRWIIAGAVVATIIWLAVSFLFSLYMNNVGGWERYYGSVTALVVMMSWVFISSFVVMIGAEVNAQIAHLKNGPRKDSIKSKLDRRERAS